MTDLSPDVLANLAELAGKASPRPWKQCSACKDRPHGVGCLTVWSIPADATVASTHTSDLDSGEMGLDSREDAAYIVAACNAVPALVAEIATLRERCGATSELLSRGEILLADPEKQYDAATETGRALGRKLGDCQAGLAAAEARIRSELATALAERDGFESIATQSERENTKLREALALACDCIEEVRVDYSASKRVAAWRAMVALMGNPPSNPAAAREWARYVCSYRESDRAHGTITRWCSLTGSSYLGQKLARLGYEEPVTVALRWRRCA